jgi:hypothetical protein
MSGITVSPLASSQPTVGGINLVVSSTYASPIVSFQYFVYPGDNANSDSSGSSLVNSIYNRTVNVGSPQAALASTGVYSLFVETTQLFPNYDYYVVVLAVYSDGTNSGYSDAQLLPLTPAAIELEPYAVTLTRDAASYATTANIKVVFNKVTLPPGVASSTIRYNLGIQYKTDDLQTTKFMVVTDLMYNNTIGGVETVLTDSNGIDEAWVAIQAVRTITATGVQASSQLSNTLFANDTDIPLAPRDLRGEYFYYEDPANIVLNWLPSYYEQLGNISGYNVYRINPDGTTVRLGSGSPPTVRQRPNPTDMNLRYTYTDSTLSGFTQGQVITYFVRTLEENGLESMDSNYVSFSIMIPSGPPLNLDAFGVANPVGSPESNPGTQDVTIAFQNPTLVNGLLVYNYTPAFFRTEMIDVSTNNVIATEVTTYDPNKENFYIVVFNNKPFNPNPSTNVQNIKIVARLITFQNNGDEQIGLPASKTIEVGPKPIFLELNTNVLNLNKNVDLTWNSYTGLQGYRVISPTLLTTNTLTTADKSTQEVKLHNINIPPISLTDPYLPFFGCFEYVVPAGLIPDQTANVVVQTTASNQFGTSQELISGPLFIAP